MAVLHAKGEMTLDDHFVGRSIIGTEFHCRIDATCEVGGRPAVVPVVSGRAWITGTRAEMLDPADPFPAGYRVGDTWPAA